MRRILLIGGLMLAVSGCAVYQRSWYRPGGTAAELDASSSNCASAALDRFPPMTFGAPGFFSTPNTYCTPTSGGLNCNIIGAGYLPQVRSAEDTNEVPRQTLYTQCMMAGGWRPFVPGAYAPDAGPPGTVVDQALTWCEARLKRKPGTGPMPADFNQCVTTRVRELSGTRAPG